MIDFNFYFADIENLVRRNSMCTCSIGGQLLPLYKRILSSIFSRKAIILFKTAYIKFLKSA